MTRKRTKKHPNTILLTAAMEDPPIPEKPFLACPPSETSITIAWIVRGNVSDITHFTLYYRRDENDFKEMPWLMIETDDVVTEFEFENLLPNSTYKFRVSSSTAASQSPPSEESDVLRTTLIDNCCNEDNKSSTSDTSNLRGQEEERQIFTEQPTEPTYNSGESNNSVSSNIEDRPSGTTQERISIQKQATAEISETQINSGCSNGEAIEGVTQTQTGVQASKMPTGEEQFTQTGSTRTAGNSNAVKNQPMEGPAETHVHSQQRANTDDSSDGAGNAHGSDERSQKDIQDSSRYPITTEELLGSRQSTDRGDLEAIDDDNKHRADSDTRENQFTPRVCTSESPAFFGQRNDANFVRPPSNNNENKYTDSVTSNSEYRFNGTTPKIAPSPKQLQLMDTDTRNCCSPSNLYGNTEYDLSNLFLQGESRYRTAGPLDAAMPTKPTFASLFYSNDDDNQRGDQLPSDQNYWLSRSTPEKPTIAVGDSVVSRSGPTHHGKTVTNSPKTDIQMMSKGPQPEKPTLAGKPSHTTIPLKWDVFVNSSSVKHYTVSYKAVDRTASLGAAGKWETFKTKGPDCNCVVNYLTPQTSYRFFVSSTTAKGVSIPSLISDSICTQNNPALKSSHQLFLPTPEKPMLAGDVTDRSIPLVWCAETSGFNVTHFTLTYIDWEARNTNRWLILETTGPATHYTVKNLRQGTSYLFQVACNTDQAQSYNSKVSNVITTSNHSQRYVKQIPPRPTQPFVAGRVNHNSIPLSWRIPRDSEYITHFTLNFKKTRERGWITLETNNAEPRYTIQGLDATTAYVFSVASNTDHGVSSPSPVSDAIKTAAMQTDALSCRSGQTGIPIPNKPNLNGMATMKSVPLTWTVNGDSSCVTHFELTYKKTNQKGRWMTVMTDSADRSYTVIGLEHDTVYHFRVASLNNQGQSRPSILSDHIRTASKSNTDVFQSAVPPIPKMLQLSGTPNHNSVTLSWTIEGTCSAITHYTLTFKSAGKQGHWITVETDNNMKRFTVDDLVPDTPYQFRIASNTDSCQSCPSETTDVIRTTREPGSALDQNPYTLPVPEMPKAIEIPGHNYIKLTWSVPGNASHVTHYTLTFKVVGKTGHWMTVETESTDRTYTIEDLTPDTPYQFRVAANSHDGQSSPSTSSEIMRTAELPKHDPSKIPPKPVELTQFGSENHNKLTVVWRVEGNACSVKHFILKYRIVSEGECDWKCVQTDNANTWCSIEDLQPDVLYQVTVAAVTVDGHICKGDTDENYMHTTGKGSEGAIGGEAVYTMEHIPVLRPLQPTGTPRLDPVSKPTQKTISVVWEPGTDDMTESLITHFTLNYRVQGKRSNWEEVDVPGLSCQYTLADLHPSTGYLIRVRANTVTDTSCFSEEGGPFVTDSRTEGEIYRERLQGFCTKIRSDKDMPLYQVPLEMLLNNELDRIQMYEFGTEPDVQQQEKVLLVVGATGAGKSTLINGFFNYVIGVQWSEKIRFRLVKESDNFEAQHQSQTKVITVYKLHHHDIFQIPYTLTIIDTPGFGDTGGIDNDKQIIESIGHLFRKTEYGIDHIDGIGFVAQSSLPRLTPTQKYIFDSILSLFGKDIGENIFLLITFSDSQRPPVLASTTEAKLPYKSHYKFNNSALFAKNETVDDEFDRMFWKMGASSFQRFLHELTNIESKSLNLTKEVLDERERLEVYVTGIQREIHEGLNKLEQYRVEVNVVRQHEADIEKNKNFSYTVDEHKMVEKKLDPGQHTTNCLTCNRTCHFPCGIPNDDGKRRCWAMDRNGNCRICPKYCIWSMHRNVPFRLDVETVTVKKTADDLKKRYEQAQGEKLSAEKLTNKILEDFYNLEVKVLYMTSEVRRSLERLAEIALRPNPLSAVQYLEILIRSERTEAHKGFQARIAQLENVKVQAKTISDMAADGYDPFDEFRDVINQAKNAQHRPSFQDAAAHFRRKYNFNSFFKDCKKFLGFRK